MGQLQWRLCLVATATFLLGSAYGSSSSHSLLYFRHALLIEGQPQFAMVTYLDSQPIQHYDSNTRKMSPFTMWNNKMLNRYYEWFESTSTNTSEGYFLRKLQLVSEKNNQSNDEKTK